MTDVDTTATASACGCGAPHPGGVLRFPSVDMPGFETFCICPCHAEYVAEARLMAAAPNLLAACEAYLAYLDDGPDQEYEYRARAETLMRAAVVKARGPQAPSIPVWAKDEPPIDTET